ncbi:DUF4834 family protein [Aurantibacter crassamenti]|uniref:DUF4834 family protein n=1 Tax=Aurantibacter crassamenti TaxID=1837375 RepID=UPI0019397816|nr:DUF4834 family protein [Aurantibacter crassamenti]MBM1107386.1 DUF4834 family protein [Aurantibacter crassamenti]
MVLLKTILIILLVYYGLKILAKWYGPKLFNYAARKTEQKFKERFGDFTQQQTRQGEDNIGDISVKGKRAKSNTSKEPVGEYIEFEELD